MKPMIWMVRVENIHQRTQLNAVLHILSFEGHPTQAVLLHK